MTWQDPDPKLVLHGNAFIERATGIGIDTKRFRRKITRRFREIHREIESLHMPPCGFHLAEDIILTRDIPGPIVECGCFHGAMTAKLSVLAEIFDKRLLVFDSFQGLPHDEDFINDKGPNKWKKGMFAVPQEIVERNVREYGEIQRCKFIPGFFEHTVHQHQCYPSFIFIDVDLTTSAKTCIEHFWPRLKGPRFYSHEGLLTTFVAAMTDEGWWRDTFNESPPDYVHFGKGAPSLWCLKK